MEKEREYFERVKTLVNAELKEILDKLSESSSELQEEHRYMWEEINHNSEDFEKLGEVITALDEISVRTDLLRGSIDRAKKLRRMQNSPYFGRIDFTEDGDDILENIYIGRSGLTDKKTYDTLVYDWRSPIAGMFYRFGAGKAYFMTPPTLGSQGEKITGEISLKRQYMIKDGKLEFFFDTGVNINDDILMSALAKNSSEKMRSIVETIQARQDEIIRDDKNGLLIVQGCAGSGKTSVALHRAAYLMYDAMNGAKALDANNILIVSPSDAFSVYISDVLPELGEKNTQNTLFEDIFIKLLDKSLDIRTRASYMEELITNNDIIYKYNAEFKGSQVFMTILERLGEYYVRKIAPFRDVYFAGRCLLTAEEQKAFVLNRESYSSPLGVRLRRLEERIRELTRELQQDEVNRYIKLIEHDGSLVFDSVNAAKRMTAQKLTKLYEAVKSYTRIDYFELYKLLFTDKSLFDSISHGLKLPKCIDKIINASVKSLNRDRKLNYEDAAAICYLITAMEGRECANGDYKKIRHVIVDEAQDYSPLHYGILRNIFKSSRYTVLGDIGQSIGHAPDMTFYNEVAEVLGCETHALMQLERSYRSSNEIVEFSKKIYPDAVAVPGIDRHEEEPTVITCRSAIDMDRCAVREVQRYMAEGFESAAIICKSISQARQVYARLSHMIDCNLQDGVTRTMGKKTSSLKGINIMPVSLSKGLEFDAAVVYDGSSYDRRSDEESRLLYVACTRALHRLSVLEGKC